MAMSAVANDAIVAIPLIARTVNVIGSAIEGLVIDVQSAMQATQAMIDFFISILPCIFG
jgi:hypothetical protein